MNNNVKQVQEAFHEARIEGEKRLQATKTDAEFNQEWERFSFVMIGFELRLQIKGVDF